MNKKRRKQSKYIFHLRSNFYAIIDYFVILLSYFLDKNGQLLPGFEKNCEKIKIFSKI